MMKSLVALSALILTLFTTWAQAQGCPEKNLQYWQAFPPGGESDIAARHCRNGAAEGPTGCRSCHVPLSMISRTFSPTSVGEGEFFSVAANRPAIRRVCG